MIDKLLILNQHYTTGKHCTNLDKIIWREKLSTIYSRNHKKKTQPPPNCLRAVISLVVSSGIIGLKRKDTRGGGDKPTRGSNTHKGVGTEQGTIFRTDRHTHRHTCTHSHKHGQRLN